MRGPWMSRLIELDRKSGTIRGHIGIPERLAWHSIEFTPAGEPVITLENKTRQQGHNHAGNNNSTIAHHRRRARHGWHRPARVSRGSGGRRGSLAYRRGYSSGA